MFVALYTWSSQIYFVFSVKPGLLKYVMGGIFKGGRTAWVDNSQVRRPGTFYWMRLMWGDAS